MSRQYKGISGYGVSSRGFGITQSQTPHSGFRPPGHVTVIAAEKQESPTNAVIGILKSKQTVLARFSPTVGVGANQQQFQFATFTNPSAYLRCKVAIGYEMEGIYANADINAFRMHSSLTALNTFAIKAININPESGKRMQLDWVYPTGAQTAFAAIPDAYELDTAANAFQIDGTLDSSEIRTAAVGSLVLNVTWEADPDLPVKDREYLFNQCNLAGMATFNMLND